MLLISNKTVMHKKRIASLSENSAFPTENHLPCMHPLGSPNGDGTCAWQLNETELLKLATL